MSIKNKRLTAYLIDLIIVSLFVSLLAQVKVLNPFNSKYTKAHNNYLEFLTTIENVTYENTNELFSDEYIDIMHDLEYYSFPVAAINAAVITIYFSLFPYFNNNQTVGKRIMKIKVVHQNREKEVTFYQHFIRSLILPVLTSITLTSALSYFLNVVMVLLLNKTLYIYVVVIITNLFNFFGYADIIKLALNQKGRSLHDLIARTEVIECA